MNTQPLASASISVCKQGTPALTETQCNDLLLQLPAWRVTAAQGIPVLQRCYSFSNFAAALAFTNRIGALAEWGKVTVSWWTHTIGGLHLNDFIMAARCDAAFGTGHASFPWPG
jgi:4a-hydroxytetrahydrobiopterin dehydratase